MQFGRGRNPPPLRTQRLLAAGFEHEHEDDYGGPLETSFSCYLIKLIEVPAFDCSQLIAGGFSIGERLIGGSKPDARERLRDYLRKYYEIIRR